MIELRINGLQTPKSVTAAELPEGTKAQSRAEPNRNVENTRLYRMLGTTLIPIRSELNRNQAGAFPVS
jgi:hypothetical protein